MKNILFIILLSIPLLFNSQIMDCEYTCDNYKYFDLNDNSKNFSNQENKIISIFIDDDFTGKIEIKNNREQILYSYTLNDVKVIDGKKASAIIFENCKLKDDYLKRKYILYFYYKKEANFGIIFKYQNSTLEHYDGLIKFNNKKQSK